MSGSWLTILLRRSDFELAEQSLGDGGDRAELAEPFDVREFELAEAVDVLRQLRDLVVDVLVAQLEDLSAILRGWLGARFDLPGRRLTTTELLAALAPKGLERATYQQIEDFLIQCDLAKFAKAEASRADMEVRLQNAYRLVERLGDAPASDEDDEDAREGTIDVVG